jgi:hypothetical protein
MAMHRLLVGSLPPKQMAARAHEAADAMLDAEYAQRVSVATFKSIAEAHATEALAMRGMLKQIVDAYDSLKDTNGAREPMDAAGHLTGGEWLEGHMHGVIEAARAQLAMDDIAG